MSQQHEAALPDPRAAYQTLFDGVHQRCFFQKLASVRPQYYPQNQKQAMELLELAGQLRLAEEEEAVKEAQEGVSPFAAANMALAAHLKQAGFTSVERAKRHEQELSVKQAAADLAADPAIFNAVLSLKAAQAERELAAARGR